MPKYTWGRGVLLAAAAGPHAIGGATSTLYQLGLLGTFDPSATAGAAFSIGSTLTLAVNEDAYGMRLAPTFTEFSSGTHALLAGLYIAPTITAGAASTTTAAGASIATFAAASGTTNAAGLYISAAPTAATNNYSLWVDAGDVRLDGNLNVQGTGPHAIGGATITGVQVLLTGSFTPASGSITEGLSVRSTLTPAAASGDIWGIRLTPTLVESSSGSHGSVAGLYVQPTVTAGAATVVTLAGIQIGGITAQTGTTNAVGLYIDAAPTAATNNYALWVDAGLIRYDGTTQGTVGAAGGAAAMPTPAQYVQMVFGATTYVIACFNAS